MAARPGPLLITAVSNAMRSENKNKTDRLNLIFQQVGSRTQSFFGIFFSNNFYVCILVIKACHILSSNIREKFAGQYRRL